MKLKSFELDASIGTIIYHIRQQGCQFLQTVFILPYLKVFIDQFTKTLKYVKNKQIGNHVGLIWQPCTSGMVKNSFSNIDVINLTPK